jgi:methionyl-tRNA formyltransferase
MNPLRIVFAGTPAFGVPCLEALAKTEHHLVGIYTQPDRPAGRGQALQASAIKQWALAHHTPILQPVNFKTEESLQELSNLQPDLMVVIAYGLILPEHVLNIPRLGCINVHASLLPAWRGASPIQHAILHGDAVSGVAIMQMDKGMDTGAVYQQVSCPIFPTDNATSLHDRLSTLAIEPLIKTITSLQNGEALAIPQNNGLATYAPKINKIDALVDWAKPATAIDQQIRAFNPWPIAYTTCNDKILRIYSALPIPEQGNAKPGTILNLDKNGLLVATGKGALLITTIQFPGSKPLQVKEWLHAGKKDLQPQDVLGPTAL